MYLRLSGMLEFAMVWYCLDTKRVLTRNACGLCQTTLHRHHYGAVYVHVGMCASQYHPHILQQQCAIFRMTTCALDHISAH